jgi:hypothetical protein
MHFEDAGHSFAYSNICFSRNNSGRPTIKPADVFSFCSRSEKRKEMGQVTGCNGSR